MRESSKGAEELNALYERRSNNNDKEERQLLTNANAKRIGGLRNLPYSFVS